MLYREPEDLWKHLANFIQLNVIEKPTKVSSQFHSVCNPQKDYFRVSFWSELF